MTGLNQSTIYQLHAALKGKEHIIWDWNGTLLSDVDYALKMVNILLKEHDLPQIDLQKYRQVFDFPIINYYKTLGFDFEKVSFEELCHRYVDQFMNGVYDLSLIPEMESVLLTLHSAGIDQSVLSATDQPNLNAMIKKFNLDHVFRFVYGIENKFAASKIQRGHELIEKSGIELSKTVIIGDTLHDLDVAKALGIEAVLLSHGHQCVTRLKSQHHLVIEAH